MDRKAKKDLKSPADRLALNDGAAMPCLGFGVYMIPDNGPCKEAVLRAFEAGYRHLDTASFYHNEQDVGRAVRESGLARKDLFITTKLWPDDQGHAKALKAFEASRARLGLDYVDLYLIHWPAGDRLGSWQALNELKERGLCRSVGVSNFTIRHLKELASRSGLVPAVNQVEFSPFNFQKDLLAYCQDQGIVLQAYSPLTRKEKFSHPVLRSVATKHSKTPAQILIRWCLQHGVCPLPKSADPARIRENVQVFDFELASGDMQALDGLHEGFRTCWDPENVT
jgi:diketogulonate reductase-like aldo/keto reductase